MIGLKISGQQAEVNPDTRIDIKLVNPLFNEEALSPGSYTLPFELPGGDVSPSNAEIFKNLDVIENQEKFAKQEAKLFFDGVHYKSGKIRAKTISSKAFSTSFTFGLTAISDDIKTKKLRELLDEEIVIDDSNISKKIYLKSFTTKPFPIIINGENYDEETLEDLATAINANENEPTVTATVIDVGVSSGGFDAPYLILESSASPNDPNAELGVELDGSNVDSSVTETGYRWAVHIEMGGTNGMEEYYAPFWDFLEGYFTGAYPDDKLRFPAVFNSEGSGRPFIYNGLQVEGASVKLIENIPCSTYRFGPSNGNSIHPFVRMAYVLDTIAEYFNFEWEGDFINSADTAQMLIWNPNSLDLPMVFVGTKPFNFWSRSFNVKDLVPDISVYDFLRALAKRYNLGIYRNEANGKLKILYREQIAKSTTFVDITTMCGPLTTFDDHTVTGIKLTAQKETEDLIAVDDTFTVGEAETKYDTALSTLTQTSNYSRDGGVVSAPRANQERRDKFEFRVFYYKGLVDNGVFEYPNAGINAISYTDKFTGEDGLYENFWKRWLMYEMKRKSVPVEIDFGLGELKSLDWEVKRRFAGNNYLIHSLDFSIENARISVCKAVLYTMV